MSLSNLEHLVRHLVCDGRLTERPQGARESHSEKCLALLARRCQLVQDWLQLGPGLVRPAQPDERPCVVTDGARLEIDVTAFRRQLDRPARKMFRLLVVRCDASVGRCLYKKRRLLGGILCD